MQKFKEAEQPSQVFVKINFSETFGLEDSKLRSEWNWDTFKNTMTPIFIENKLLGIKVKNSRISAFVSGFKHYLPPSGFRSGLFQSSFDDKELFEALSFVSQYCRVWKKTIVETTVPGLFLFNDISRSDLLFRRCMCPLSIRVGTRRKNEATTNAPDCKRLKFNDQETDFQNFKNSIHHLFNPQILCFDSLSHSCPFKSKYSQGSFPRCIINKKLIKINFPPSLREDYLKFTIFQKKYKTASFPYKVETFSNPTSPLGLKCQTVPDRRLNYDEFLKMKSDELNDLRNQKFLREKLAKHEKQSRKLLKQINDRKACQPSSFTGVSHQADFSTFESLVRDNVRLFLAQDIAEEIKLNKNILNGKDNKNGTSPKKTMPQIIKALTIGDESGCSIPGMKNYSRSPRSRCLSIKPISRTSRVTLTKEFYYCTPPIPALDLLVDHTERCIVNEFRVGHEIFGHVTFHGETNVIGMDLDTIIEFNLKEFNLYPDEDLSQIVKIGDGLKRPATVVLFKVWPMSKAKTDFITDPEELARRKYAELLKRACNRMHAGFLDYNSTLGHWRFKINC
ncbi:unnamed protein product [Allacma fusca]|uniref:Peptidase S59 domain-containing protein n=1 Tax=Allacma fusca TaxID=39272 RepID=A0A8J2M952_9HEXA|nr:unnamed protein product [Allacma fusca]